MASPTSFISYLLVRFPSHPLVPNNPSKLGWFAGERAGFLLLQLWSEKRTTGGAEND